MKKLAGVIVFYLILLPVPFLSCNKEEIKELPRLSIDSVNTISRTSACFTGAIIDEGSDSIVDIGICWSLESYPTLEDQSIPAYSHEEGQFGKNCISGLAPGTTYYVRAFATTTAGTNYGNEVSFTTRPADIMVQFSPALNYGTVLYIDGNSYRTIMIGSQEWMAENLKTTRYSDGTTIPLVTLDPLEGDPLSPGYCWFQNTEEIFKDIYGAYYN
jgi:hypothetical protein